MDDAVIRLHMQESDWHIGDTNQSFERVCGRMDEERRVIASLVFLPACTRGKGTLVEMSMMVLLPPQAAVEGTFAAEVSKIECSDDEIDACMMAGERHRRSGLAL